MIIKQTNEDLLKIDMSYEIVNFVDSNGNMDLKFEKNFDLGILKEVATDNQLYSGGCYWIDRILNLIIKDKKEDELSYELVERTFMCTRRLCLNEQIKKIAIPISNNTFKDLKLDTIKEIIEKVFKEDYIEILFCENCSNV